tara:strand:- start:123 stop:338 length:216 start_codon:yes stop_codon:yes gene_type:complete
LKESMKHIRATGFAIILAAGSLACTNHKLDHNVNVNEPIHIKLDINLVLKKEVEEDLTDLFGEENEGTNDE